MCFSQKPQRQFNSYKSYIIELLMYFILFFQTRCKRAGTFANYPLRTRIVVWQLENDSDRRVTTALIDGVQRSPLHRVLAAGIRCQQFFYFLFYHRQCPTIECAYRLYLYFMVDTRFVVR